MLEEKGRDDTGTFQHNLTQRLPHSLLFVKWEIKSCGLKGLREGADRIPTMGMEMHLRHSELLFTVNS